MAHLLPIDQLRWPLISSSLQPLDRLSKTGFGIACQAVGSPSIRQKKPQKKRRILIDISILCPAHLLQQMSFPVPVMTVFVKLRIYRRGQKRLLCFLGYWADLWWVTQHSIQYGLVCLKPHQWQHSLLKRHNNFMSKSFKSFHICCNLHKRNYPHDSLL